MAGEETALEIHIAGLVQGVGYRYYAKRHADRLGLNGYVTNLPDGRVLVRVCGSQPLLELFQDLLRRGPAMGRVTSLDAVPWDQTADSLGTDGFQVRFHIS